MDSLVLIERLDELMAEAKPIPFTREARVDRDEVYKLLDRMRTTLPVEFERARWTGREDSQEDGVETQLRQLGASIAELRRAQRAQAEQPSGPPLTEAASEQVREIVEAAERTASELVEEANAEAGRMRAEAARGLKEARDESERLHREARAKAAADAADYLRRVEEATQKMLERAASADSEINGMLARLRGSGGSVIEDLEAIMNGLTQIEIRRSDAPKPAEPKVAPAAVAVGASANQDSASAGGATTAFAPPQERPAAPQRERPASSQQERPAAPVVRRPARTAVEGIQEPPEAPIRPRLSPPVHGTPLGTVPVPASPARPGDAPVRPSKPEPDEPAPPPAA